MVTPNLNNPPATAAVPHHPAAQATVRAGVKPVPSIAGTHNAAASDFQKKFVDGLGIPTWNWPGVDGITQAALNKMTPDKKIAAVQKYIGEHVKDPNKLLDAIGGTAPNNKDLQKLVKIARGNPEMAKAFHNAVVKDPSMLEKLPTLLNAKSGDGFTLGDMSTALSHPKYGKMGQKKFTEALNHIANTDADFDHLLKLGSTSKKYMKMANMSPGQLLDMAKNNPDELIRNMLEGSNMDPQMQQMLAGIMKSFLPLIVGFLDPEGFMLKPYIELGGQIDKKLRQTGARVMATGHGNFQASAQRTGNVPDMGEKFAKVMHGKGFQDPDTVMKALKSQQVDPKLREEIAQINNDPTLRGKFGRAVRSAPTLQELTQRVEKLYDKLNDGASVDKAVNAMTPAPGG